MNFRLRFEHGCSLEGSFEAYFISLNVFLFDF